MELGMTLILSRNLIVELDKFKESGLSDVDDYVTNLKKELSSDYKSETTLRMGSETFADHAVRAMIGLNPKHKMLYRELAVYIGGNIVSHTDDFREGEVEREIRKSIRKDQNYKSFRK